MSLELTGRVSAILEPETGESRSGQPWIKQSFVITYGDEIEREVAFQLFGEYKVRLLQNVKEGDTVSVGFSLSSKRGSSAATANRYFTEVNAYKLINLSAQNRAANQNVSSHVETLKSAEKPVSVIQPNPKLVSPADMFSGSSEEETLPF